MTLGDGIRRNAAKVTAGERQRLAAAFVALDTKPAFVYPDVVTYWDKQEDIHKNAHAAGQDVHGGPAFLPWHRVLIGRLEAEGGQKGVQLKPPAHRRGGDRPGLDGSLRVLGLSAGSGGEAEGQGCGVAGRGCSTERTPRALHGGGGR